MKNYTFLLFVLYVFLGCKNDTKMQNTNTGDAPSQIEAKTNDASIEGAEQAQKKTAKALIEALKNEGFTVSNYVDEQTKDTIIMQQFFMVFIKQGSIHGLPLEESAMLQQEHLEYLNEIKALGFADIIESFGDDGDIKGFSIYNVPTLKKADSLAKADPMVKAGQYEIEIHPWWAKKELSLY